MDAAASPPQVAPHVAPTATPNPARLAALAGFVATTLTWIAFDLPWLGAAAALLSVVLILRVRDGAFRRRMGVLLGCVSLLGAIDVNTSLELENFLAMGIPFALVVVVPALLLRRSDPGVIGFRLLPTRFERTEVIYTILSIPLAYLVLSLYWWVNPNLHLQWAMPAELDDGAIRTLFLGINLVGIWDELFFVNTVFAVLRSLFPYRIANVAQVVVYTSVLYDMAFIGIGPLIIAAFAWTQGSMFERSRHLLFVLIVHLIVDYFLVAAIVGRYYPGIGFGYLWRHGL
jgi:hypothetical protein